MRLQFLLPITACAGAFGLPTLNETTESLEKREDWGWIGSFVNETCSGKTVGDRPEIRHKKQCVKFTPTSNYVGASFGSSYYEFVEFEAFTDDQCTDLNYIVSWTGEGPGACGLMHSGSGLDDLNVTWQSVMISAMKLAH